jgi:enediyne biosynthesis protein E4
MYPKTLGKQLFFSLIVIFFACQKSDKTSESEQVFSLLNPAETGVDFVNKVAESPQMNIITYRNFYNGGGVAVGDVNNDGLPDLFFTANQQKNRLYLNKGNMKFEDITAQAGVAGRRAWSTGVAMADVNADGLLDIYVCNSGDVAGDNKQNELFINQGWGAPTAPKKEQGVEVKTPKFIEAAAQYGLDNAGYGTHASFFDYDRDGDLDCYILNNSFKNPDRIDLYHSMRDRPHPLGDRLMRNDSRNEAGKFIPKFTDVSQQAGIHSSAIGFGLGVATADVNGDHWPDLYISNDFFEKDYLYINQRNGTFKEELNQRLDYCSTASMGGDIADINGDGAPEIFTTDMLPADNERIKRMVVFEPYHQEDLKYRANYYYQFIQNCLHLNNGQGNFQEIANLAGVAATDWSWGAMIFDFQNDGHNDIFVANGIYKDLMDGDHRDFVYDQTNQTIKTGRKNLDISAQLSSTPLQNYAFVNSGSLQLNNQAEALGLKEKTFSNGSAYADLDLDGDLDLVLNNLNQPASIYQNNSQSTENSYLKIKLEGTKNNKFGIGAKVILKAQGKIFVKENFTNRGFQSSIEPQLLFGLGSVKNIDQLEVIWPNGKAQKIENVSVNKTVTFAIADANQEPSVGLLQEKKIFELAQNADIFPNSTQTENDYNDFDQEPLLNQKLSATGPKIEKADVNNDGLDDVLMLGARNNPDKLYLQNKNGSFRPSNKATFERDKGFESSCAAFFDLENDGDQDLLIGSGGNEVGLDKINYIVRLYVNDGAGNYSVDPNRIPPAFGNFSAIKIADVDKDGYQDALITARCIPGSYGLKPQSYLLKNVAGNWTDITPPALKNLGMITDAVWADTDADGWQDLLLVGDWLPITLFKNNAGSLDQASSLTQSSGWWQCIKAADLDGDGDTDFVLGNWGLNSKFRPNKSTPLTMQVGDFDANGKSEFVINYRPPADAKNYPFASKMDLTAQLPILKKNNLSYLSFSKMTFEELFPVINKENYIEYYAETLQTSILWNHKGQLQLEALPAEAQYAPTMAIALHDFDADGKKDIVLGGNMYELKPQLGRLAASRGLLLHNLGKGQFGKPQQLGVKGQIRDFVLFNKKLFVSKSNMPADLLLF